MHSLRMRLGPVDSAALLALDEKNVARGSQAFIAGHQDSVVRASDLQKLGAAQRRVRNNVGAEQPQPSRQSHQHPVSRKSGTFIHRDGLYYISDRRNHSPRKYKVTV